MQIRIANTQDAEFIALLGRITFTETFGHLFSDPNDLTTYLNETFSVQKIRNGIQKENNMFWLALDEELPIGYAKLKLNSPSPFVPNKNSCQLQKIYVLKDFFVKKAGRALQNELLTFATKTGYEEIWLSVLKSNTRAINFYEKNNFKTVGDHTFSIGKEVFDFQAMAKKL